MNDLTVFEENGKLFTNSREVAVMVEKEHSKLLRDIRVYCEYLTEANLGLSEYFIESEYQDSTGRTLPCYLCTKKGCDMIANKLQGKKGVIFTAKYIEAFEKMADFIKKGLELNQKVSFTEQVESVNIVSNMLNVNEAGKILMLQKLYKSYDLPYEFLPKYEDNGSREYKSATELLKRFGLDMSARAFNLLLLSQGYLEVRTRTSKSNKDSERKYKALSEKGLKYGENLISPQNQRETQPMYYVDSFMELYEKVTQ